MKKAILNIFVCLAVMLSALVIAKPVSADMLITPTRIVFEGRDRFGVVTLVNPGDKATTYEMGWRYFKMQESGNPYVAVGQPVTEFDLSKHVVFSPRRVTLEPGAKQKIRLALRRPAEIPDGDYHVHLGFFVVPEAPEVPIVNNDDTFGPKQPQANVKVNVSYTIPVVLRSGEVGVTSSIEDIELKRNPRNGFLTVVVPVTRGGGSHSVLGHLMVYHVDENGREERVGEISNAHIFPEVDRRLFDVQLIKDIKSGSLRIVMFDYKFDRNRTDNYIYTERTFSLN